MCDSVQSTRPRGAAVPVAQAVGHVLAHDITEIRQGEFKGRAFKKGHVVRAEDVERLMRLGKEHLVVLEVAPDEVHEDEAALMLARALMGPGVESGGAPSEGKINIVASHDGLLRVDKAALKAFNMLGEVMCATLHENTVVKKGQTVAGTRAIPLVVKRSLVDEAVAAAGAGVIGVASMRAPRAGIVITGNEVFSGRIKDAFEPIIRRKVQELGGTVVDVFFAPDDEGIIQARLRELMGRGADLLITTGGMSVDPDDVTRFAISSLGATEVHYGSPVLPGAMVLVAYVPGADGAEIPVLGIPACGMYHGTTVFDLILPRILAGQRMGREQIAEMGHGGLCLYCKECRYPICPFGKG